MSCEHESELTAYLDGELSLSQRQLLEAHLATCPTCPGTLRALQGSVARLSQLSAPEPSPALRRAVLTAVSAAQEESLWARFRSLWLLPVLGATAAAILALVYVQRGTREREMVEGANLELAMNFEVVKDLDVMGVEKPEDLDVVVHLHELEAMP